MANEIITPTMLLNDYIKTVNGLINQQKHLEVSQTLQLKLYHIVQHHRFGAQFRDINLTKKSANKLLWEACRKHLQRYKNKIGSCPTQQTSPTTLFINSTMMSSARKRSRNSYEIDEQFEIQTFQMSPSAFSPTPKQHQNVQQPYEGFKNVFASPGANGSTQGRRQPNHNFAQAELPSTRLFAVAEQAPTIVVNNASPSMSQYHIYQTFFEKPVYKQEVNELLIQITGNEDIDELICMDDEDIHNLGDMMTGDRKQTQKFYSKKSKIEKNKKAIKNFVLNMKNDWIEGTQTKQGAEKIYCEDQIKKMEEHIRKMKKNSRYGQHKKEQ